MTIDFEKKEDYQKFLDDLSQCILMDYDFMQDFTDDVALSISQRHLPELSAAILDRLIERKMQEQIQNENPRPQENA